MDRLRYQCSIPHYSDWSSIPDVLAKEFVVQHTNGDRLCNYSSWVHTTKLGRLLEASDLVIIVII